MDWNPLSYEWNPAFGSYDSSAAYAEPLTPSTIASDVATQAQAVDTSGNGDYWGGWLKSTATQVLGAALAKDAAQTKADIAVQTTPAINTALTQQRTQQSNNTMMFLLLGGLAFVALKA